MDSYTGNFTGRGYVKWNGPNQSCAAQGKTEDSYHNDITGACQGDPADWLKIPVYIDRVGTYIMDLRNLHLQTDGDNDIWTHLVDRAPPINRVGSHHPGAFDWLSWGPPTFSSWVMTSFMVPAVYTFYVAGRSPGFAVDRIAIYRKTGQNAWPAEAHDLATPAGVKQAVPTVSAAPRAVLAHTAARATPGGVKVDICGRCIGIQKAGVRIGCGPDDGKMRCCLISYHRPPSPALISGSDAALLYDSLKAVGREEEYGGIWGAMTGATLVAVAVLTAAGGLLYGVNVRLPFYASTAVLALAIPAALCLHEPPRSKLQPRGSLAAGLWHVVRDAVRQGTAYRSLLAEYAIVFSLTQLALWFYQPYFERCGIPAAWFGFIFAAYNLTAAAGSRWAMRLQGRCTLVRPAVVQLAILAVSWLLMGTVTAAAGVAFALLQQLVRGWLSVATSDRVNRLVRSEERATLLSLCTLAGSLTYAALLPVAGLVADAFSPSVALVCGGLACVAAAATMTVLGVSREAPAANDVAAAEASAVS